MSRRLSVKRGISLIVAIAMTMVLALSFVIGGKEVHAAAGSYANTSPQDFRAMAREAFDLINEIRKENGVEPLKWKGESRALTRAVEITTDFSHDSASNIQYTGENVGMTQNKDVHGIVNAWMRSPGHKANILRSYFSYAALAVVKCGSDYYWVNDFYSSSYGNQLWEEDRQISEDVSKIDLSSYDLSLGKGGTYVITAEMTPYYAKNKKVTWVSSNPDVVSVEAIKSETRTDAKITGISAGNATIKAVIEGGCEAECKVTIRDEVGVKDLWLPSQENVRVGETLQLAAVVKPMDAGNKKIIWKSQAPEYATVDENGLVTGIKSGQASIYATTEDGKITKRCLVHVHVNPVESADSPLFRLDRENVVVEEGKTVKVNAIISDRAKGQKVQWSIHATSVATVDEDGVITGIKAHDQSISLYAVLGNECCRCEVMVVPPNYFSTETKPAEQKPEEQKPEEQKPEEQKPEEQKPEEQKPEEQKPEEQNTSSQPSNPQPESSEPVSSGETNKGYEVVEDDGSITTYVSEEVYKWYKECLEAQSDTTLQEYNKATGNIRKINYDDAFLAWVDDASEIQKYLDSLTGSNADGVAYEVKLIESSRWIKKYDIIERTTLKSNETLATGYNPGGDPHEGSSYRGPGTFVTYERQAWFILSDYKSSF